MGNTMNIPSDAELQEIVHRVVERIMRQGAVSIPSSTTTTPEKQSPTSQTGIKTVAIGADHGGFNLKQSLVAYLKEKGFEVVDCGTHSTESVDYPDFAQAVARMVADGSAWRGVIVDGAGIGSCMAANKVKGVRAAMCYDHATAFNSREHNDANVLTLGSGLIGPNLAKQILDTFLNTVFGGGRHARRVDKIMLIEKS
jgi:ribose 5-phosphate isomerase B